MKRIENLSGSEAYRLHIPRAMLTIYGMRNKRGVGHVGLVNPNQLDSTFILSTVKWILAEIIRIESSYSADETFKIVNRIIERPVENLWSLGDVKRILTTGLKLKEKILLLLFHGNPETEKNLIGFIEAKNIKHFRSVLHDLHKNRLIEYDSNLLCTLSPLGYSEVEKMLFK